MQMSRIVVLVLFVILCLSGAAAARCNCVTVTRYSLTGIAESNPAEWPLGLGTNITTTVGNNHSKVVIRANPVTGDIGNVTINGDSTNRVWVLVTTDTDEDNEGLPTVAGVNWAGLDDNRGYLALRVGISGDLTSDIYLDDSSDIQYLRVEGTMEDHIRIGGNTSPAIATNVRAGVISSAGDIVKLNGRIAVVDVEDGNAMGDIKAQNGSIGTTEVDNGNIGAPGQPVAIEAADHSCGLYIGLINTPHNIYANVDCNTSTAGADGVIGTFFAGTGATPAGDFHGSLKLCSFSTSSPSSATSTARSNMAAR